MKKSIKLTIVFALALMLCVLFAVFASAAEYSVKYADIGGGVKQTVKTDADGKIVLKSDPYARHFETAPNNASKIYVEDMKEELLAKKIKESDAIAEEARQEMVLIRNQAEAERKKLEDQRDRAIKKAKEEAEELLSEKMDRWVYLNDLNERILNGDE